MCVEVLAAALDTLMADLMRELEEGPDEVMPPKPARRGGRKKTTS